ncbi:MAG: ATP-binding protein [Acidobacteriota bacterium]|nr:ATP-binding protein [Acidobacteriota bacterium]
MPTVAPSLKIAFIGSHGVGKTTLCYGLAARLKALDVSVEVVREVARRCPLPINEETGVAAQSWILHTQIAEELAAQERYPVVICDRSVLDNYVYLLLAAGPRGELEPLLDAWLGSYGMLVRVPIVDEPSADGVRATDPAFQRAVDERLLEELEERGLPLVELDPRHRQRWVDAVVDGVWRRLQPPQLRLL